MQMVSFGDRNVAGEGRKGDPIWADLPDDFGFLGYAVGWSRVVREHLA